MSTPVSESHKRFSDPPTSWDSRGNFVGSWGNENLPKQDHLAPIHLGDGPPWSEDEDLQSPVVVSSRHRKHKSSSGAYPGQSRGRGRASRDNHGDNGLLSPNPYEQDRASQTGNGPDGTERYSSDDPGRPTSEYMAYPREQARRSLLGPGPYNVPGQRDSHFATGLPRRVYTEGDTPHDYQSDEDESSAASSPGLTRHDESRYSRDYQFTIASPDEEMHGKAVALFDFERENENELPLVEGQVIWVSYRHGQGWLVAEDPKTQESGLVPEEYVRLIRDIRGGLNSLTAQAADVALSPVAHDSGTPTQAEHNDGFGHAATASSGSNGYQQPIISTFSTSSKDLHPYPQHLLGTQAGQAPPQVIPYHGHRGGSQANTPTLTSPFEDSHRLSSSQDLKTNKLAQSADKTADAGHDLPSPESAMDSPSSSSGNSEEEDEEEEEEEREGKEAA